MKISVVIPSRNSRDMTLRCLSFLTPGSDFHEIIVVDDDSSDQTAGAIASARPDVRLLRMPAPSGFAVCVNRGLAAAGGELLWLLNSDTEAPPDSARLWRAAFAGQTRLGVAGAA